MSKSMVYGGVLITASTAGSGLLPALVVAMVTGTAVIGLKEYIFATLLLLGQLVGVACGARVLYYASFASYHLVTGRRDDRFHARWIASERERIARERRRVLVPSRVDRGELDESSQPAIAPAPLQLTRDERALLVDLDALTRKE